MQYDTEKALEGLQRAVEATVKTMLEDTNANRVSGRASDPKSLPNVLFGYTLLDLAYYYDVDQSHSCPQGRLSSTAACRGFLFIITI